MQKDLVELSPPVSSHSEWVGLHSIPVTRVSNGMVGVQINLGQWPSPHSRHQCTLVAEALVIIPVVTAMLHSVFNTLAMPKSVVVRGQRGLVFGGNGVWLKKINTK